MKDTLEFFLNPVCQWPIIDLPIVIATVHYEHNPIVPRLELAGLDLSSAVVVFDPPSDVLRSEFFDVDHGIRILVIISAKQSATLPPRRPRSHRL